MSTTRVVYYLEGEAFGGVERYLVTLVERLDRGRYEPVVLGRTPESVRRALSDLDVEVQPLPPVTSKWNFRAWIAVLTAIRRLHPEVFHGMQSHSFSGQYALASAKLARVPRVIVTAHLPTPAANGRQARLGAALRRGVDVQIVPGEWARSELARMGQLAKRTVIVPNAIDIPDFIARAEAREKLGVAHDAIVVGGLMRLEAYKRPDLVVDLAHSIPGVTVVLFGEGPEWDSLRMRARGANVVLTGFRADAAIMLRALDVFVHPCPVDNQPLAVLEAMAAGVPVVVADRGGVAAMVDHERTGLTAEVTLAGMATSVKRLLDDRDLADRLSGAAVAEIKREADPRVMTRRIEGLYKQCDDDS